MYRQCIAALALLLVLPTAAASPADLPQEVCVEQGAPWSLQCVGSHGPCTGYWHESNMDPDGTCVGIHTGSLATRGSTAQEDLVGVGTTGPASGSVAAVSITGDADGGLLAVSVTGDARSDGVAISVTGDASGLVPASVTGAEELCSRWIDKECKSPTALQRSA